MKRRDFMLAGAALGAGLAAAELSLADDPKENGKEDFTAEEALQELMEGNQRFVSGKSEHPRMTEDWLKRLTKGQNPLVLLGMIEIAIAPYKFEASLAFVKSEFTKGVNIKTALAHFKN